MCSYDYAELARHLLKTRFGGNQTAMADAMDVGQPFVSRVVAGKAQPGKKFLSALSALVAESESEGDLVLPPSFTGEPKRGSRSNAGYSIPIASVLLPGTPIDHQPLLTGQVHYVAECKYRDSLYAISAKRCVSEHLAALHLIAPDDLLIIEADSDVWLQLPQFTNNRFCVEQSAVKDGHDLSLVFHLYDHVESSQQPAKEDTPLSSGREPRSIMIEDSPEQQSQCDIVGVVVEIVRVF